MEGNVSVSGINRGLISSQGIIKPVVDGLRKRKKSNKEMKQVPKQQPKTQAKPQTKQANTYGATKEDIEFSKRQGIPLSEVMAQGGVTPQSVIKEIKQYGAYSTKIKPSGLYKKPAKKK
jgi:hypothetical protein